MDLTEFLLARIAEDEDGRARYLRDFAEALRAQRFTVADYLDEESARVLAECDAKRRIVEAAWADHLRIEGEWGHGRGREELSALNDYPQVVQLLALPYVSHPDYQDEWRP